MKKKKKIHILDCTIRDGSYLINYQFTAEDTYLITAALCNAGLERIEVGHGLGLGAQDRGKGMAADLDVRYIKAAVAAAAGRAKIGVFFIPGIGRLDDIRQAADAGLNFIRIGTNIDQRAEGEQAIALAKKLGLEVWANLMKSYVLSPLKFARVCRDVEESGADITVLVDSAGGMTPDQVKAYAEEALAQINIPLGFHGHNNLDMVIANCLSFVKAGGTLVDTSLRGMGRSAGNAATEVVSSLLLREGFDIGSLDHCELMRLAENLIAPGMPRDTGLLPEEIASGIAYFHSSFQNIVDIASHEFGVESFETILELPSESRLAVSSEMARQAATQAKKNHFTGDWHTAANDQWVKRAGCTTLKELRNTLRVLTAKTGFQTVMSVSRSRRLNVEPVRVAPVRVGQKYCVGHVESASPEQDALVMDYFMPEVVNWLVDRQIAAPKKLSAGIHWLTYDDDRLLVTALDDFLRVVCPEETIYLPTSDERLAKLICSWLEVGISTPCDVGLALSHRQLFDLADLDCVKSGGKIVVIQPDAVAPNTLTMARERQIDLWRLDLGEALLAEVSRVFNTHSTLAEHAGRCILDRVTVVAGGIVGEENDIVVNSVSAPSLILGKADGCGGVVALGPDDEEARRQVLTWMAERKR